jgi:N-acetylglucosaminyl-diphospho-decaprenol L-rhamnosyltransferase
MRKQLSKNKRVSVTIIIVTFNNEATIENCLSSLIKNKIPDFQKKIILVDNDSQDKTPPLLARFKKEQLISEVIFNDFNLGFGRAINEIIEKENKGAEPDFFFILNPDAVLEENALEKLLTTALLKPKIGLLSCRIMEPKTNKVLFEEGSVDFLRFKTTHTPPRRLQSPYLTGCALLIRNSLIKEIGAFDPHFFLYYEDADLSRRALSADFEIATENSAVCFHNESHSSSSEIKDYFLTRNALYFFHKHYPKIALPYFWSVFFLRFAYHKLFSKKKNIIRAMRDFWHN